MPRLDSAHTVDRQREWDTIGDRSGQRRISSDYRSRTNRSVKVLDFVQLGGPKWTVDRTIFELWLGRL